MFTKVMAVLIAAVLVFSGAAATAYASQASLPTDALYGVKTFGENIRISLSPQADSKLGLALEFTQRRVDEMAALNSLGMTIPAHVAAQYQEQIEYTLRLAAGLSDDHLALALEQIHTRLQDQLRTLDQLHQANPDDPALILAREQLREQLRLVEAGLQDPQQFRQQMRARERLAPQTQAPSGTEAPNPSIIPGTGNGNANANGNLNGNENENANGNMNGNSNDDDTNGNMNGNGNGNENGDDHGGNGNGNDDSGGGNGNDNDDDNGGGGNGNDNDDDNGGGGGNGNDNDDDNGGGGNGNDNGGGGGGNENGGSGGGNSNG